MTSSETIDLLASVVTMPFRIFSYIDKRASPDVEKCWTICNSGHCASNMSVAKLAKRQGMDRMKNTGPMMAISRKQRCSIQACRLAEEQPPVWSLDWCSLEVTKFLQQLASRKTCT